MENLNFETIYKENKNKVYSFILMKVRNKELAEDLCGETFLKVYKFLDQYNETKGQLNTWIYNIAKNTIIDHFRSNESKCMALSNSVSDFVQEDGSEKLAKCTTENPHTIIVRSETHANVRKQLDRLPKNIRETAKLFFIDDLSLETISNTLNLPMGTVKAQIFRAREIMQKSLIHSYESL